MKKKICVILPCNIFMMPFFRRYEKLINDLDYDFDLVIWNRAGIAEETKGKIFTFNSHTISNDGDKRKIIKFIKFAAFTKNIIKKNDYNKIIILGSYSGIIAFLSFYLSKKYRKKYWLDIRDYTYEWFKPYYKVMALAIRNSYATSISSHEFETFLPEHKYSYIHNIDIDNIEAIKSSIKKVKEKNKIRISFIGLVRYYSENIKLLNALKNDKRFILQYYGMGSDKLREYCNANGITNTDFSGMFPYGKTVDFYNRTDIINNVYDNINIGNKTSLSNKLYYSLALSMPILVAPGTYMEKITKPVGISFTVNFQNKNLGNDLYEFYKQFVDKSDEIKVKCKELLKNYLSEDRKTVELFIEYLNQ